MKKRATSHAQRLAPRAAVALQLDLDLLLGRLLEVLDAHVRGLLRK